MNEFVVKKINTHYASLKRSLQNSGQNSARRPRKKTRKEKYLETEVREIVNSQSDLSGSELFNLFSYRYD